MAEPRGKDCKAGLEQRKQGWRWELGGAGERPGSRAQISTWEWGEMGPGPAVGELAKHHNCPAHSWVAVGVTKPSLEACKVVMTWQRAEGGSLKRGSVEMTGFQALF